MIVSDKETRTANFEVNDGQLQMSVKNYDTEREASTVIDCSHLGECLFFAVGLDKAIDVLASMSSETVTLALRDQATAVRVKGSNEERIIMPVKRNED